MWTEAPIFRALAACLSCIAAAAALEARAAYPEKPVRVIVPFAPGGNADVIARILSQRLSQALEQPFVIENRAGANGAIGTEIASKAPPDGHTLLFTSSSHALNPGIYPKLGFDTVKDFAPISLVGSTPLIVTVTSALPAKSIKELVAIARARPGELSYASAGNGSTGHLAGALFNGIARVNIVHVPYKATQQAMTDVTTGQVQVMYPSTTAVLPQIKAGKLRGLAVTARERSSLAPDLPTMHEAGMPGYEATIWSGMIAPANTPPAIVSKLNTTIVQVMQTRDARDRIAALGADPVTSTPEAFARFIATEIAKWGKVIKAAGVKID